MKRKPLRPFLGQLLVVCVITTFCAAAANLYVGNVFAAPLPDTGQTKCYNNTAEIPCPAPGEAFYGQDGNYLINPPSYIKLDADGNDLPDSAESWVMVRDNVTGLIWEVKTDDGSIHDRDDHYNWQNAQDVFVGQVNDENFGGHSDWRLPTITELASITDMGGYNPAVNMDYFLNTLSSGYWSSTTNAGNTDNACCVGFDLGYDGDYNKSGSYYVRAVRGGQAGSLGHLVINGDGTVTDTVAGLMWQQVTEGATLTWETAITRCETTTLGGYDDWRLPNLRELRSIVDYGRYNPAINGDYFPDTLSSDYWSSTTNAYFTDYALYVSFGYGRDNFLHKSNSYYVRAVRGGQAGSLGHLVILTPSQGSSWNMGSGMNISWDTQSIPGNVKISLSRRGGKANTFETITDSTPNDGAYTWTVTGSDSSYNCILKIEPISDASKGTTQGLFTIYGTPEATTGTATTPNATSATLSGTVNPNCSLTAVVFEWGVDESYGNEVPSIQSPLNGATPQAIGAEIKELTPGTTYHFRCKASNGAGTTYGADETFTPRLIATCVSNATEFQTALTTAQSNGADDTIQIVQGAFNGNFIYASTEVNSLSIEGGYAEGCKERTIDSANTVLDGGGRDSVLMLVTNAVAANFSVEGLTLQNGSASTVIYGGGLYANTAGEVTVTSSSFTYNASEWGGGAFIVGRGRLADNAFTGNTAKSTGGGVVIGSTGTLTKNSFTNNTADTCGGAYVGGTGTLTDNIFTGNTSSKSNGWRRLSCWHKHPKQQHVHSKHCHQWFWRRYLCRWR